MKSGKIVMKQWSLLVLASAFGATAYAAGTPADNGLSPAVGVKWANISNIVHNLEVHQDGRTLSFAGVIPARCAPVSADYDYVAGQHVVTIHMAAPCEAADFKWQTGDLNKMMALSKALPPISLQDESGKVVIRSFDQGDIGSDSRIKDADLTIRGNSVKILSSADDAAAKKQAQIDADMKKVSQFCARGDFPAVSQALDDLSAVVGDVSDIMKTVAEAQFKKFSGDLKAASSADAATSIYNNYVQAAQKDDNLDPAALTLLYMSKRFALLQAMVDDFQQGGDTKPTDVDKAAVVWMRDLRDMGSDLFKKYKNQFSNIYGGLASAEFDAKQYDAAQNYALKAQSYADTKALKADFDKVIGKMDGVANEECIKKVASAGGDLSACDKYRNKSKEHYANYGDYLSKNAKQSDDAMAEYNSFMSNFYSTFGQDGSMQFQVSGYGAYNPNLYSWGYVDQFKYETYQEGVTQRYMNMYYGGGNNAGQSGAAPSGPLYSMQ